MAEDVSIDEWRVLPPEPFRDLDAYVAAGGGAGLTAARAVEPEVVIGELEASGLRGRGGAGFPTGAKWRTIAGFASDLLRTTVVVNAAEGEPGTFKDRAILLANPYAVIEGALIAAHVVGAASVTVATKERFGDVVARVRAAIDEVRSAGWSGGVEVAVLEGPPEYLVGEETALLEVVDGRPPLPRLAPPWRHGTVEVVRDGVDLGSGSNQTAGLVLGSEESDVTDQAAPPALVNNVETLANVPAIVARGATWFRSVGTPESPGTMVCTLTGAVERPRVVEVPMGSTLRSVLDRAAAPGSGSLAQPPVAVLMGVSNPILTAADLDAEVSYEGMQARGTALGSASFIAVGAGTDPVAVAAGVSRFLGIESCGQCTPCKQDGLELAMRLRTMCTDGGTEHDVERIEMCLDNITVGARCNLATQHQLVVGSILRAFPDALAARVIEASHPADPIEPVLIGELEQLDTTSTADRSLLRKRADWTFTDDPDEDPLDDAMVQRTPQERFTEHRA